MVYNERPPEAEDLFSIAGHREKVRKAALARPVAPARCTGCGRGVLKAETSAAVPLSRRRAHQGL